MMLIRVAASVPYQAWGTLSGCKSIYVGQLWATSYQVYGLLNHQMYSIAAASRSWELGLG